MHLVNVIGPPAVGKMTVGRAVCELTGFRLFHNHMSIEPLLGVFEFGSPSFNRLNSMIRREVIAEAVAVDLPGLVFTYAWDFGNPRELQEVQYLIEPVVRAGCPIDFVELYAAQQVRLAREGGADRMDHKRSKRDVDWARAHVVQLDELARFNTDPAADPPEWPLPQHRLVRFDNSHASPQATAERIVEELALPRR